MLGKLVVGPFLMKFVQKCSHSGQSPIKTTFHRKIRRKKKPVFREKRQILVFRRQNVAAPERTGGITSRHENLWVPQHRNQKVDNLCSKMQFPTQHRKH